MGRKQSGLPGFRLANPSVHGPLLTLAREEARKIAEENPRLEGAHGEALRLLLNIFEGAKAIPLLAAG